MAVMVYGGFQDINSIGQREDIGKGSQIKGQRLNRDKEPAEEDHRESKEIGKRLGLEDLTNRHRDEKAQEGRCDGDQKDSPEHGYPVDACQIDHEKGKQDRDKGVGYAK